MLGILLLQQPRPLQLAHVAYRAVELRELAQLLLFVRVLVGVQGREQRVDHSRGSVNLFDRVGGDVHVELVVPAVVLPGELRRQ